MAKLSLKLSHVAISARDVDASARFYTLLGGEPGFRRANKAGRTELLQMRFGDTFVELLADAPLPCGGHFALASPDIDATWKLLNDNGHAPLDKPALGASGVTWFFVDDPGGNSVEITAPSGPGGAP